MCLIERDSVCRCLSVCRKQCVSVQRKTNPFLKMKAVAFFLVEFSSKKVLSDLSISIYDDL